MALQMKGSEVVAGMKAALIAEHEDLLKHGVTPKLAIVRVGARGDDLAYERGVLKRFDALGIAVQVYALPEDIAQADFDREFKKLNDDPSIHGILLFRPLPQGLDDTTARNIIDPRKDVDSMSPINAAAKLYLNKMDTMDNFVPCAAESVIEMLAHYKVNLDGKNVVIVGRSALVGRPLAMRMLDFDATVTICHRHTVNLPEICRNADIIVSAAGKAGLITPDCVTEKSIIVDVGINTGADGKLCGDVDFAAVEPIVAMVSPVPGGIGAITTSVLAKHTLHAARLLNF